MAIDPKKHEMPAQDPKVRAHNFDEVALGYSEETALAEAARCLNCKNRPCVAGCPVNVQIPEFIQKVKEGDFETAYQIISETSSLPAVSPVHCSTVARFTSNFLTKNAHVSDIDGLTTTTRDPSFISLIL